MGDVTYLNHAGTSWPKPSPVQRAVRAALEESPAEWARSFAERRAHVASAFGISDPERLLLTPGCTAALRAGLETVPWKRGDVIVTSRWEHQALRGPIRTLEAQGVRHEAVRGSGPEPFDLTHLEEILQAGPIRMVAVCAASNVTGALLPIRSIIEASHRFGVPVLVDAAQTAGWLDLDAEALRVDLLAFAGHKGPQAPWGIGGLYRASTLDAKAPGYCDTGSVDRLALAGLCAGLSWLGQADRKDRLDRARSIVERIAEGAQALAGVELLGPPIRARVPSLALRVGGRPAEQMAAALFERGVVTSGGRQCAPMAHETLGTLEDGVVRISAGPATADEAAERCLEALRSILEASD